MMQKIWEACGSRRFKTIGLIILTLAKAASFMGALALFRPADNEVDIKLIDMEMRKQIREFASVAKTGLYIKNFELFDITADHFIAGLVVWFEFLTDQVMPDTIKNFSFVNGKILDQSVGAVNINGPVMRITYDVRVEFKSQLNYYRYPFDDHRISLVLTNTSISPSELYFTVDNSTFTVASDLYTNNWEILELDTAWGYRNLVLDSRTPNVPVKRPIVAYSINFAKSSMRHVVIIFIPLFISLLFGFLTFIMGIENTYDRQRMSLAALTALLSYRFIIDRMMPTVGYLTTTDMLYILYLLLLMVIFIFQMVLSLYTIKGPQGSFVHADYVVGLKRAHDMIFILCISSCIGYSAYVLLW
jgi:hypothetical protein